MTRFFLILVGILFLSAASARAQSTVTVIGAVTPGDCVIFNSTTVIKDAGTTSCSNSAGGVPGGANGTIQYNNSGNFGGFTASGDCTVVTSTGVFTCLNTNGVSFGPFATDTATAATAALNLFSSTLQGLVPASGGAAQNFLSADGTFKTPYGGIYDAVRQYGADPTGVASSTTAINNAIAAACAPSVRGIVWIQPGTYLVNGGINATNITSGCTIQGGGLTGTVLKVTTTTNAILDMTGSSAVYVNDLQLVDTGAVDKFGILLASSTVPNPCNVNHFTGISVPIRPTAAAIHIYGCSDSSFVNSQISCFNTATIGCVYISATNDLSATSSYTTVATGTLQSGDWRFESFEIHDLSHQGGGFSTVAPLYISGAFSPIKFIGGVIAGPTASGINAGLVTIGGTNPGGITFLGVQFESDSAQSPAFDFYLNGNVTGLVVQGCAMNFNTSVFSQSTGAIWNGVNFTGNNAVGGVTYMFYSGGGAGTNGLLTRSIIDAQALQINMGAGGTVTHTVMFQPGTITAGTQANNGSF